MIKKSIFSLLILFIVTYIYAQPKPTADKNKLHSKKISPISKIKVSNQEL